MLLNFSQQLRKYVGMKESITRTCIHSACIRLCRSDDACKCVFFWQTQMQHTFTLSLVCNIQQAYKDICHTWWHFDGCRPWLVTWNVLQMGHYFCHQLLQVYSWDKEMEKLLHILISMTVLICQGVEIWCLCNWIRTSQHTVDAALLIKDDHKFLVYRILSKTSNSSIMPFQRSFSIRI